MTGDYASNHEGGAPRTLEQWCHDEGLIALAEEPGPLYIEELPSSVVSNEHFQALLHQVGWPDRVNAAELIPQEYATDEAFWDALCNKGNPLTLNNLINELIQEPRDHFEGPYGYMPASHRLNLVAPEFMRVLRPALGAEWDRIADAWGLAYKSSPADIQAAAHLAYKLLCRLITEDDARKKLAFLGLDGRNEPPVTSIGDYLLHDS